MVSDAREIYEAVLGKVKEDLPTMISKYEEKIVRVVLQECDKKIKNIEQQYARKLKEVQDKNSQLEKRISRLEQKISELKKENAYKTDSKAVTKSTKTVNSSNSKIDMSKDCIKYGGYKFDGWVYYANDEMGDFLYKVRVNGTENQQLTDYSVSTAFFRVKNGKLYFKDKDYKEHCIEIVQLEEVLLVKYKNGLPYPLSRKEDAMELYRAYEESYLAVINRKGA